MTRVRSVESAWPAPGIVIDIGTPAVSRRAGDPPQGNIIGGGRGPEVTNWLRLRSDKVGVGAE